MVMGSISLEDTVHEAIAPRNEVLDVLAGHGALEQVSALSRLTLARLPKNIERIDRLHPKLKCRRNLGRNVKSDRHVVGVRGRR